MKGLCFRDNQEGEKFNLIIRKLEIGEETQSLRHDKEITEQPTVSMKPFT